MPVTSVTITSINISSGPNTGGQANFIIGTGFVDGYMTVFVGGTLATDIVVDSSTKISFTVPSGINGAADVTATRSPPNSDTYTAIGLYTYESPSSSSSSSSSNNINFKVPKTNDLKFITQANANLILHVGDVVYLDNDGLYKPSIAISDKLSQIEGIIWRFVTNIGFWLLIEERDIKYRLPLSKKFFNYDESGRINEHSVSAEIPGNVGDDLYVSETIPGGLQNTTPVIYASIVGTKTETGFAFHPFPYYPAPKPFTIIIDTTKAGSAAKHFVLPCNGGGYNAEVDWGDESSNTTLLGSPGNIDHSYVSDGVYTIKILEKVVGGFPTIYFNNGGDKLKLLQISKWGLNKWVAFTSSFYGCSNLVIMAIDGSTANTGSVTDLDSAWAECSDLTSFPLLDFHSVINFNLAWYGCSGLTNFPLINVSAGTHFQVTWSGCSGLTSFPLLDFSSAQDFDTTWYNCTGLTSFPLIDTHNVWRMYQTWQGCSGLTSFPLLDCSAVTDMRDAWSGCSGLTSFPLINTISVQYISGAWIGCTGLTSFPNLAHTSGITIFDFTWGNCTNLTSFPSLDTTAATSMYGTWTHCTKLTSFPSLAHTVNVTNFGATWVGCTGMTGFPSISFEAATNLEQTWQNCTGLTSFPVLSFPSASSLSYSWYGCTGLTSFPTIDTSAITNLAGAWQNCSGLTSFPSLNTANCINFSDSWNNCSNLSTFPILNMRAMTNGTDCFKNITLDTTSYSNLITDMALGATTGVHFNGGYSKYNIGSAAAHDTLTVTRSWTIADGGEYIAPFQIVVDTTKAGSPAKHFILPCNGSGYDADVDWGDGGSHTTLTGTPGAVDHEYPTDGTYTIKILENSIGGFPTIYFAGGSGGSPDLYKLMEISQWGTNKWITMGHSFESCNNLVVTATDNAMANTGSVSNWDHTFAFIEGAGFIMPLLDMHSATNLNEIWIYCYNSKLYPFPALDTSNATVFDYAWFDIGFTAGGPAFPTLNMRKITSGVGAFYGCTLPTTSYSNLLIDMALGVTIYVTFDGGNSKYNDAGSTARATLVARHWTITDGGHE